MNTPLATTRTEAYFDLLAHKEEFDAVVCGGDHHGIAVAAVIAAMLNKPLMIVCMSRHNCVVSHITCIGETLPSHRLLYVDDWFSMGATKRFVHRALRRKHHPFRYFAQSGEPVPIVATYAATTREYREITA